MNYSKESEDYYQRVLDNQEEQDLSTHIDDIINSLDKEYSTVSKIALIKEFDDLYETTQLIAYERSNYHGVPKSTIIELGYACMESIFDKYVNHYSEERK